MRLEEVKAFSAAMMLTIKSKSSWKPRPNPKKPNKKLGQPKMTFVFDLPYLQRWNYSNTNNQSSLKAEL